MGNLVKEGTSEMLSEALDSISSIEGVDGCLAYVNGLFGTAGDVPDLIRRKVDSDDASRIVF